MTETPEVGVLIETVRAQVVLLEDAEMIRKAANLSYRQVAEALGVAESTVHRWEHGERHPRPKHARAYADLLFRVVDAMDYNLLSSRP